jgi:hypothetical protein
MAAAVPLTQELFEDERERRERRIVLDKILYQLRGGEACGRVRHRRAQRATQRQRTSVLVGRGREEEAALVGRVAQVPPLLLRRDALQVQERDVRGDLR